MSSWIKQLMLELSKRCCTVLCLHALVLVTTVVKHERTSDELRSGTSVAHSDGSHKSNESEEDDQDNADGKNDEVNGEEVLLEIEESSSEDSDSESSAESSDSQLDADSLPPAYS